MAENFQDKAKDFLSSAGDRIKQGTDQAMKVASEQTKNARENAEKAQAGATAADKFNSTIAAGAAGLYFIFSWLAVTAMTFPFFVVTMTIKQNGWGMVSASVANGEGDEGDLSEYTSDFGNLWLTLITVASIAALLAAFWFFRTSKQKLATTIMYAVGGVTALLHLINIFTGGNFLLGVSDGISDEDTIFDFVKTGAGSWLLFLLGVAIIVVAYMISKSGTVQAFIAEKKASKSSSSQSIIDSSKGNTEREPEVKQEDS